MNQPYSNVDRIHGHRISLALAVAALAVPLISIVGWLAKISLLASYGGQFIPMAPGTALCFVVMSIALVIALQALKHPLVNLGIFLASGTVAAYGSMVFLAWLTGLPLNPDSVLFGEMGKLGIYPIGRMSPATGVLVLLSGISLAACVLGLSRKNRAGLWLSMAIFSGSAVAFAGTIFTLAYELGTPLLYGSAMIPMSLPTALSFILLGGSLTVASILYSPVFGRWYRTLSDINISTQLRLGLGIIMAFVLLLSAMAWRQSSLLWTQTSTLHDHPMRVLGAVAGLETDIESMSRYIGHIAIAENDQQVAAALQNIEIQKLDAERQFATLRDRYLGPRSDIITLENDFERWNVIRNETVQLVRQGKMPEARTSINPGGALYVQTDAVRSRIKKVSDLAQNEADQVHLEAISLRKALNSQMIAIVSGILLFSLMISYVLQKGTSTPLHKLTIAAEQLRQGNLGARSGYASANEFGILSTSFDAMADVIETQMRVSEHVSHIAGVMLQKFEIRDFCRELIKSLVELTGSQIGAIYLLNQQKTEFEHFESVGLSAGRRASFSAVSYEGEFGAALATGQMQRITGISPDTRFTFASVSGEFAPREIITIPLLAGKESIAVISLASIRDYDITAIQLLEDVLSVLTARMNGVLAYRQTQELAEQLANQNCDLEMQTEELAAQTEELAAQNTELYLQKRQLDEANRLKSIFLSNVTHELRTPLNSMITLSGVLNRRLAGTIPDEEFSYLAVIERNGRQLLAQINDILDLSRIEAGHEEICPDLFAIRDVVGEVLAMLDPLARERNIALVNQVSDDLPLITSDRNMCRHVLQNLAGNALKFCEAGSVSISAIRSDDELHVSVRDTGIGIPADQLPHIFDEFCQADDSVSRKYGGTGLGLTIARKYAVLLRGDITVESTSNQGSTFILRLPITLSPAEANAEIDRQGAGPVQEELSRDTAHEVLSGSK